MSPRVGQGVVAGVEAWVWATAAFATMFHGVAQLPAVSPVSLALAFDTGWKCMMAAVLPAAAVGLLAGVLVAGRFGGCVEPLGLLGFAAMAFVLSEFLFGGMRAMAGGAGDIWPLAVSVFAFGRLAARIAFRLGELRDLAPEGGDRG